MMIVRMLPWPFFLFSIVSSFTVRTFPLTQSCSLLLTRTKLSSSAAGDCLPSDEVDEIRHVGGPRADVYGEITEQGFRTLCQTFSVGRHDSFVDLGSGHGAAVLQAAIEFGVQQSMGIELSRARHDRALAALQTINGEESLSHVVSLQCGDAASGDVSAQMIQSATTVWSSNLLFGDALQRKMAHHIASFGQNLRLIVSLKEFPDGIEGFEKQTNPLHLEMSWTAGKEQRGHPPLPGHPCCVYLPSER